MKVFVTGATGYLGGSIAQRLIEGGYEVVGLVRSQEKSLQLKARGIEPLIGTLDDSGALEEGVSRTDATINAANSDHYFAVQTIINAMAGTGKTLIHTSGSSIICDDAMGAFSSENFYADDAPFPPMLHRVPRIEIDRIVRIAGVVKGLRAVVIAPSMVYGKGIGLSLESDQLPKIVARSRELGAGVYLGQGLNIWSNVYIGDLVDLYAAALKAAPSGSFFFAENGELNMVEVARAVSYSLGFDGKVNSWEIGDAIAHLGGFGRVALASNARVRAVNARLLGWDPRGPSLTAALIGAV
jgi:nucleoside-diphosphate-sugar epimerase